MATPWLVYKVGMEPIPVPGATPPLGKTGKVVSISVVTSGGELLGDVAPGILVVLEVNANELRDNPERKGRVRTLRFPMAICSWSALVDAEDAEAIIEEQALMEDEAFEVGDDDEGEEEDDGPHAQGPQAAVSAAPGPVAHAG